MSESIPLSYIRIWCRRNQAAIDFTSKDNDVFRIDVHGTFIKLPDGTFSSVSTRDAFPVVNRYPTLSADCLETYNPAKPSYLVAEMVADKSLKRVTFVEILDHVQRYFSLINHLSEMEVYVAVRCYESGLIGLPQINTAAARLEIGETLSRGLIRMGYCSWEPLLSVCLDLVQNSGERPAQTQTSSMELSGEIMVAIGKLTRTQLEHALKIRRTDERPLDEILLQMGALSPADIARFLSPQQQLEGSSHTSTLLGDLLVQHGKLSPEDLVEALRLQKVGRQPLHAVFLAMGLCTQADMLAFRQHVGIPNNSEAIDEQELITFMSSISKLTDIQVEEARRVQNNGRQVLGEILIKLNRCSPDDIELALNLQKLYRRNSQVADSGAQPVAQTSAEKPKKRATTQEINRQKIGATLIGLGACTQEDFEEAIDLQFAWREQNRNNQDSLGQELFKSGHIDAQALLQALELQTRIGKPLGNILVDQKVCTPEAVVDTLIRRDEMRRNAFAKYLSLTQTTATPTKTMPTVTETSKAMDKNRQSGGQKLVDKISSWLSNRQQDS